MNSSSDLVLAEDYYWTEEGFMVFTAHYLLKRGYCCHQGCRHCPYLQEQSSENKTEREILS